MLDVFAFSLDLPVSIGKDIVDAAFDLFTRWLTSGTAAVLLDLARVLSGSTTVQFNASFVAEFTVLAELGGALAVPLLVLSAIQAILRQDLGLLLRTAFVRVPAALLMSWVVIAIVRLSLSATDELSAGLLSLAGPPATGFLARLSDGFLAMPVPGGFVQVVVVLAAAFVAFLLWVELAVRSAAVVVATLFVPLALCGLVWPASAHWARRLGESIAALILAKPVIAAVLSLAVRSVLVGDGLNGLVQGVALLLLAAFSPFTLLKLVPFVEHGANSYLEGLPRRTAQSVAEHAASGYESLAARAALNAQESGARPVELHPGTPMSPDANFEEIYAQTAAEIAAVTAARERGEDLYAGLLVPMDESESPDDE